MNNSRKVLAITDFSPSATNACWRAGMVAAEHGWQLTLFHTVPAGTDRAAAQRLLQSLAGQIESALDLEVGVVIAQGDALRESVRASRDARMVVLGCARSNALRQLVMGTAAERLIRLCRLPVLVVKRPAESAYRRLLVPVELGPCAPAALAAALAFSPGATVEVFHALSVRDEVTLRAAEVSEGAMRRYRRRVADRALGALRELILHVGQGAARAVPALGFGPPGRLSLVKEVAMRAELVVIGKRRRGLLADFFLGSVTQRLLAGSRADVLVLPAERLSEGRDNPATTRYPSAEAS